MPGGVQGYDRYAYVNNNPVNGTDPSGHCESDSEGDPGDCKPSERSEIASIKNNLEKNYAIDITGKWTADELAYLEGSLYLLANSMGGSEKLNAALVAGAQHFDTSATVITVERISGHRVNPTSGSPSVAEWCNGQTKDGCSSETTIRFADDAFSHCYQYRTCPGPSYARPGSFNFDQRVQFTIVHELAHVLADVSPSGVHSVLSSEYRGGEEDMANEIALDVVSQGSLTTSFTNWVFNRCVPPTCSGSR